MSIQSTSTLGMIAIQNRDTGETFEFPSPEAAIAKLKGPKGHTIIAEPEARREAITAIERHARAAIEAPGAMPSPEDCDCEACKRMRLKAHSVPVTAQFTEFADSLVDDLEETVKVLLALGQMDAPEALKGMAVVKHLGMLKAATRAMEAYMFERVKVIAAEREGAPTQEHPGDYPQTLADRMAAHSDNKGQVDNVVPLRPAGSKLH